MTKPCIHTDHTHYTHCTFIYTLIAHVKTYSHNHRQTWISSICLHTSLSPVKVNRSRGKSVRFNGPHHHPAQLTFICKIKLLPHAAFQCERIKILCHNNQKNIYISTGPPSLPRTFHRLGPCGELTRWL